MIHIRLNKAADKHVLLPKSTQMIRSMTGYGLAEQEYERYTIRTEFKALNNKFLEINIRMPKSWQGKENELRRELTKLVERGSCSLNINVTYKHTEDKVLPLNKDVATYYLNELKGLATDYQIDLSAMATNLFSVPNLFSASEDEGGEDDLKQLLDAVNKGFIEFEKFRMKEGEMLAGELERMTRTILQLVKEIDEMDGERATQIREKLSADLNQLSDLSVDKNRFEQEIIYYIEKLDITEEKTRLVQHCNYFLETMNLRSSGKKLGFIAQEMGREINTIGSKANHFKIQQRVVEMKDELEKIKEQINNII